MSEVRIEPSAGDFAEDKDVAARIRTKELEPALEAGESIVLDFGGVRLTTQSFVHALLSASLRAHGEEALELIEFKNCSNLVRGIVETVVQYSLEAIENS